MTGPNQTPIGTMMCTQNQPTQNVNCLTRKVSFVFYCAPLDEGNPMYAYVYSGNDTINRGITDSASYLNNLPFVVIDADTNQVIYPYNNANGQTAVFGQKVQSNTLHDGARWVHSLPPINIPDHVSRIALHIANDAYQAHRKFQLFPWTVPNSAHCKVNVYELRSDLQDRFAYINNLGQLPTENTLAAKHGSADEYYGYLNGDVWLSISHEFTDQEITRLCPPETLSRAAQGGGNTERLDVNWTEVLQPIYNAGVNSRSMAPFNVQIDALGITAKFTERAVANAIYTSNRTTVQQALRRTSPRAFAALLKAAWRVHIDTVDLSSSWRPMLGSRLHKMGVGLDVTRFDYEQEDIHVVIRNQGSGDRNQPFPTSPGGRRLKALYEELNGDTRISSGAVYTPWINWVMPHDSHMHITVKFE